MLRPAPLTDLQVERFPGTQLDDECLQAFTLTLDGGKAVGEVLALPVELDERVVGLECIELVLTEVELLGDERGERCIGRMEA